MNEKYNEYVEKELLHSSAVDLFKEAGKIQSLSIELELRLKRLRKSTYELMKATNAIRKPVFETLEEHDDLLEE